MKSGLRFTHLMLKCKETENVKAKSTQIYENQKNTNSKKLKVHK